MKVLPLCLSYYLLRTYRAIVYILFQIINSTDMRANYKSLEVICFYFYIP
nr:MAG TPA: hypothetical protein [Caudoviricetes sp.]